MCLMCHMSSLNSCLCFKLLWIQSFSKLNCRIVVSAHIDMKFARHVEKNNMDTEVFDLVVFGGTDSY